MVTLKNKVVIITGASSGIGAATAKEFAKKKAKVIITARREEKLKDLSKKLNCKYYKADVTQEKEVIKLFDFVEKNFYKIDILINCAGRGLKARVCDTTLCEWHSVLDANLTSTFLCSKEASYRMVKKKIKGHIITISSVAAIYGTPTYSAYCAAKHGVEGFQRALKWELFSKKIRVSTVHPARVATEFFKDYKNKPKKNQMLPAKDLANYIVAIAERKTLKRILLAIKNFLKRIYYFFRYFF